ncbi:MAG: DNA repair protein RadA, partial [Clostridia bacterium]|nr:DNA repair protein RadA [Clostridia bacterium]
IAKTKKVLYVSAEESLSQVKLRASRLQVNGDNFYVLNENKLENIEEAISDYEFLVIDSIQTVYLESVTGSAGSVAQVRECATKLMNIAKTKQKTIFIIGHVTKDGAIAGPKVLEHIMDAVLYFEGDVSDNTRILRAVKNRFGSQQEVGVFEMTEKGVFGVNNYNGIFMSDNRGSSAGSIVTPYMSGNRCMPVEIQSLVSKTVFGMPRRMPLGIDYNKMVLSIAVLERKCYVPFYNQDVYINAMGGIKLNEPAVDLAICLSLASANKNIPIDKTVTAFGEVGLTGEVRPVASAEKRVADAIKFGFKTVILPKRNYEAVKKYSNDIQIVTVSYLFQAIKFLFDGKIEINDLN